MRPSSIYIEPNSLGFFRFVLLAAVILSCLLILYGAQGLRGTDQYWYVADVNTISNGLAQLTNNFFPGPMLRNGAVPENNYFMHNSPFMLLVGQLTKYVPAYTAWIVLNTLCHFAVALCIYLVTEKNTRVAVASIVTALYLISPIAIWQTINPLLEMYFSVLVAAQILFFVYRENSICRISLYLLFLIGVISHPIFLVPAILWGGWSAMECRRKNGWFTEIAVFVAYLSIVSYLLHYKNVWFPSSFQPELKAIVASAVPEKSNMFWHYAEILPVVDLSLMLEKILYSLKTHFISIKMMPLYLFTNIALFSTVYLCCFHFSKWWKMLLLLGLFGMQYFAMIFLQQNHPRFQQIVAIVSFVVIGIALNEVVRSVRDIKTARMSLVVLFIVTFLLSSAITYSGRRQSINEALEVDRLIDEFSDIPQDVKLVGLDVKPHNPFSYIVRPRKMLFIRTDMLNRQQANKAIEMFGAEYIVVKRGALPVNGLLVKQIKSQRFGELYIYKAENRR